MADDIEEIDEAEEVAYNPYKGTYSELHDFNRFQELDGIEWKIISHLISSDTKHAKNFWKLLAHEEINALTMDTPSLRERLNLVWSDNEEKEMTDKRLFMQPFVDDAWSKQCSSVYVYVDEVSPMDATRANVVVSVEVVVHAKNSIVTVPTEHDTENSRIETIDGTPVGTLYDNDFDKQGNIVVTRKNRATVLLKSVLAELNGLYLDGIGYLQLDKKAAKESKALLSLWNSRSYYGYTIKFGMVLGGVSGNSEDSW